MADTNPFNEAKTHYTDAKFYFEVTIDDEVQVKDDLELLSNEELSKKENEPFNKAH